MTSSEKIKEAVENRERAVEVVKEMKSVEEISIVKEDVAKVKEDVAKVEEDVAKSKEDVAKSKEDVAKVEEDEAKSKEDVVQTELSELHFRVNEVLSVDEEFDIFGMDSPLDFEEDISPPFEPSDESPKESKHERPSN